MKKITLLFSLLFAVLSGFSQPTITSFSPASGPAATTTVTIIGTNFNATSTKDIVFFGATKATVLTASTATLTVTVPVGATYRYISVTDTASASHKTAYSATPFVTTFSCGDGIPANAFEAKVDFTTAANPAGVAIGDLDGDGKADIAAADIGTNKISVLRNTGSSGTISFAAKVDSTAGDNPYGVAIGDIDGDGKPDIAVANSGSNTISVLRNTGSSGTISFAEKADFSVGIQPYNVAIGDFDGDGKPDLAVTNNGTNTISLLRNTSTAGSISFAAKADFTAGTNPWGITVGDLDGDGKSDLAVTIQSPSSVVAFRNLSTSGSFSFAPTVSFATGAGPSSVAIGDLDGDGKPDLVTGNYGSGNAISLLRNTGSSGTISFASKVDLTSGSGPISVAVGDLDGDGKPDLAIANADNGTVSALKNTSVSGTFSFVSKVDFTTGALPYDIAIGDMDGDGKPDLALPDFSDNKVSVFRNQILVPPVMTSASTAAICSGEAVSIVLTSSIASTYTWIAADNASTAGESISTQTTSVISDVITNNTTTVQAVSYTVTPTSTGGCGAGSPQVITVTVNPAPTMTSSGSATMCSGDTLDIDLTSNMTSDYTWITTDNINTTGEDTTLQTTDSINSVISNFTASNQAVTYTVTPTSSYNGCAGAVQTVTITVRPAPIMSNAGADTICSGETLSFALTSSVSATYSWIAEDNPHTTGESTTLQAGSTINNTLTNDTTINETITYTVTPTSTDGSCLGVSQIVTVLVSPHPAVTSVSADTICSGSIVNFYFSSSVPSTYTWLAGSNANITGESISTQTTSVLSDTLVNNTYSVQVVTYTVTPTSVAGGCTGTVQTVSVTINPSPAVSFSGLASRYCQNADTVALTGSPRGGIFYGYGISDTSFVPANAGRDTVVVTYYYTDTITGCAHFSTDTTFIAVPMEVPICMVTVDTTKNIIVWEKPDTNNIDSFRIYREIASSFVYIASQSYTVTSQFSDTTPGVDPNITSYKYEISVIDTCGNESYLSDYHQTINLGVSPATPCGYLLHWNDYIGFTVDQYRILRDTNSTGWVVIDSVSFGNTQYHDIGCYKTTDTVLYMIEIAAPSCTPSKVINPGATMSSMASHSNIYNVKTSGTGVNTISADNAVKIYPNPFTSQTTISLSKEEKNAIVKITDVLGKEARTMNFSGKRVVIDKGDLQPGIYSLQIISEKGIIGNEKIIIQ